MKRILFFMALVSAIATGRAAQSFEYGNLAYSLDTDTDNDWLTCTGFSVAGMANVNNYTSITIPDVVPYKGKQYVVRGIGPNAFSGLTKVEAVTFPQGLCEIGANAFEGCTKLSAITLKWTSLARVLSRGAAT